MALIFVAVLAFLLIALPIFIYFGYLETQQYTTWLAIIAPLFLGSIALFKDQLRKSLCKPKFVFSISNEEVHFHPTAHGSSPVYYLHLRVQNKGFKAKGCQIMLMAVEKEIEGTYQIETTRDPLQLDWSVTNSPYHDFARDQWRNLDIGFIENCSSERVNSSRDSRLLKHAFHYSVSHKLNAYPNGFNSGKVRLSISLFMEDYNPIHKTIELKYTGLWKDTLDEMKEELNVSIV
jgi:hypothetical protein